MLLISAEVAERFCLFLVGASANLLYTKNCLRATLGKMWAAGLTGQEREDYPSSTWKTSFLSMGVHWLLHGLRPRSMTMLEAHKFLWPAEHLIMEGQVLFGEVVVEL